MTPCQKILLATDFSESSRKATIEALRVARRYQAQVHVLHVDVIARQDIEGFDHPALADYIRGFDPGATGDIVKASVRDTSEPDGILCYAEEQGMDLIVLGTRGRGPVSERLLGSVAQRVVREALVPVLLVGMAGEMPVAGSERPVILAPVDLSERSGVAVAQAAALAVEREARLVVLYVLDRGRQSRDPEWPRTVSEEGARERLAAFVAGAGLPIEAEQRVGSGEATEVIFDVATQHGAELIVIAPPTHGRGWLDRLMLGSVTRDVIRGAPCPVLVHREPPAAQARRAAA
jgi:nucleotide-binding universal stress UspA family protein